LSILIEKLEFTAMAAIIDSNNIEYLGEIIFFHRKKAGISRMDLGMIAGVGKTVIYDIEHGKKTLKIKTLLKILKALNIRMYLDSPLMEHFKGSDYAKR